jgi:hypothetical protein
MVLETILAMQVAIAPDQIFPFDGLRVVFDIPSAHQDRHRVRSMPKRGEWLRLFSST